jgi:RNA-directed DNA polymerase
VARILGFPWATLAFVVYGRRPESYYKSWTIKKRRGGTRRIQAPTSTLYRIQKALHVLLIATYKPRPAAHGFVKDRSVATNASKHIGSRFVLNLDIQDFFPSITFPRVRGLFMAHPFLCSHDAASVLANICCSSGALPIGAPTSPDIANMICVQLDSELQKLAKAHGCWYSRYADDITFSTRRRQFPRAVAEWGGGRDVALGDDLIAILSRNGFSPNPTKTRMQSAAMRQSVTGVVVNQKTNLDRRYVRRVRAMIHAWGKYGLAAAQAEMLQRWETKDRYPGAGPRFENVLRGRLAYLAMVRGQDDPMVRRFLDQFDNLKAGRDLNHGIQYDPDQYTVIQTSSTSTARRLVTVMFTDIVNSTLMASQVGDHVWKGKLEKHDRIIRSEVKRWGGRVIKSTGDGSLAVFDSPSHAVSCAKRIIEEVKDLGLETRIGLHTGEIEFLGDDDVTGTAVNIAARVQGQAQGSELLVSQTVVELIEGSTATFESAGLRELKNIGKRVLFRAIPDA